MSSDDDASCKQGHFPDHTLQISITQSEKGKFSDWKMGS